MKAKSSGLTSSLIDEDVDDQCKEFWVETKDGVER